MSSVGRRSLNQLPIHMMWNGGSVDKTGSGSFMRAVKTPKKLRARLMMNVLPTECGIAFNRMNLMLRGAAFAFLASASPSHPKGSRSEIRNPRISDNKMLVA